MVVGDVPLQAIFSLLCTHMRQTLKFSNTPNSEGFQAYEPENCD
jgi:hypothetical protein